MSVPRTQSKKRPLLDLIGKAVAAINPDQRATSAIEFAIFVPLLVIGLLNTVEVSRYYYQAMEVENAAQMGAQAAWKTCNKNSLLPAMKYCAGLVTAVQAAVQSTSLGTNIALQAGFPSEAYFCLDNVNALKSVGDVTKVIKPIDCSAVGMATLKPADYVQINTTFTYVPLFADLTIARNFPNPLIKNAYMRLD
jgi:Flp pilus assembly protein TadG